MVKIVKYYKEIPTGFTGKVIPLQFGELTYQTILIISNRRLIRREFYDGTVRNVFGV